MAILFIWPNLITFARPTCANTTSFEYIRSMPVSNAFPLRDFLIETVFRA